jgi:hypothetical protein
MGGAYISPAEGGIAPEGSKLFDRGSELPVTVRTEFYANAVVEFSWMVGSNHGGGYLYRCVFSTAAVQCYISLHAALLVYVIS